MHWLKNLIIIILIVICLSVAKRYINIFNYVENTALFITFPIEVATVKTKNSLIDLIKKYVLLVKLEGNIEQMEKRITQLTIENHAYKMENLFLRKALNMKAKNNKAFVCEVLGKSLINPRYLLIKPIENADIDITESCLVISKNSVLCGKIHSFKKGIYLVSTLWNEECIVDAFVGKYRGIFYGGKECCVKYISEGAMLKNGMKVFNSSGFLLGKVINIEDKGFHKIAYIKPAFSLNERLVLVVKGGW
ncbi:MAG: hypothetical protein J7J73_01720 [Deltaproteobacteria bacterium]|nr:hypothetical protein [Deltaproteobacteria bacterium]